MAQLDLNVFDILPLFDQQKGLCVAQIMKPNLLYTCGLQGW